MPLSVVLSDHPTPPNVVAIAPEEAVVFDPDTLGDFCSRHGVMAEDQIAQILYQIEERLLLASWQVDSGEWRGLSRSADLLYELAGDLGMVTLLRAAGAVRDCLARDDTHALPACAARLVRLSEYGKLSEWDLQGGGAA